ncbi:MAG: helix-turn-helix transcriptional regulator [Paraprevotella sp.]|nr:helix-turn-helix transcriptional regulator [Paraprevotella sp.]
MVLFLCFSFKRASGYTIGQFCTRLHMEYACNLLLTTELDVSPIAYQSGYNCYPHFCTQFRKSMNMSPSEYRLRGIGFSS